MAEPTVATKTVELKWVGIEDMPIYFCNQFAIQHVQNEFVLTLGSTTGPFILRPLTKEEADALTSVAVKPVIRIGMTPDRLMELIGILEVNLRKYQQRGLEG